MLRVNKTAAHSNGVAVEWRPGLVVREAHGRFGMLLDVGRFVRDAIYRKYWLPLCVLAICVVALLGAASQVPQQSSAPPTGSQNPASPAAPTLGTASPAPTAQTATEPPRTGMNVVVLDPAHGGTDLGARGTGGIHESDIVLEFAAQVRTALEAQGFQVVQTRQGNANPSFDDRSAMANAQRGAIFVTVHISSTGTPGTARVYVMNDMASGVDATGLIPWDRAQAPFVSLSRKLGDAVQGLLAQRFKGSPTGVQTASVRQLRTTAAPAIAVEISSVAVEDRAQLDHMAPGVADAIARGAAAFRPTYVVPANPGERP
jgi:N-acetylmuramoyl-L-alanine amidase